MTTNGMITEDVIDGEQACNTLGRVITLIDDLMYELQTPGCEQEYEALSKLKKRAVAEKSIRRCESEAV